MEWHKLIERHSLLMLVGILLVVSVGGIVEIAPLFYLESTIEEVEGVRPYTPLEQAGRNIYVREGCYLCHSQMIRPLRDEVERYGHYSLAAESMYDHPFQWGSRRIGPDIARVGGKYSDEWHQDHMTNPQGVVPESIMPGYPFMAERDLHVASMRDNLSALRMVGVPYTDEQIENADTDMMAQADPMSEFAGDFAERYPEAVSRDFDGDPTRVTELDAMIAYLQVLGTMVDFETYVPEENRR